MATEDFSDDDWYKKRPRIKIKREQDRLERLLGSEVYNHVFIDSKKEDLVKNYSELTGYSREIIGKYLSRIEQRFLKGNVGKSTYEKLYDLITNPDPEETRELFGDLMKYEFKGLKRLDEVRKHSRTEKTWRGIDRLGLDYFEEMQKGHGTFVGIDDNGNFKDNRSESQVKTANEIVVRTLPYIGRIVDNILTKGYVFSPLSKKVEIDEDEEESVRIRGPMLDVQDTFLGDEDEIKRDLINQVSQKLIESMPNYLPEAYAMSTFIRSLATSQVIRYINEKTPFVKPPPHLIGQIRKAISDSNSRDEAVDKIEALIPNKKNTRYLSSKLIHDSIKGEILNLDDLDLEIPDSDFSQNLEALVNGNDFQRIINNWVEEYNRGSTASAQANLQRNKEIIRAWVESFNDDSELNLKKIGDKYGLSRERVRKIVKTFSRSIFHPKNRKSINELIDVLSE